LLMRRFNFLTIILTFCAFIAFGQLDISYPTNRAIFQRSNSNQGIIYFGGNFSTKLDRIDARLIPINQGTAIDWVPVVQSPSSGFYKASLNTTGGWYRLEVRGIFNGAIVALATLDKVGIGEVFVICGQSNAEGKAGIGDGASDDRVNRISNLNSSTESIHPFPTFDRIERTSIIAPSGKSAWCWGRLGDLLASRLNVPILFINTAWEGYDIKQWEVSANGGSGYNTFGEVFAPPGFPFNTIRNSIQQYTHMLGVRAVLFHQGETDNMLNTTQLSYFSSMETFIKKLRESTQKDVSFVVARVSRNLDRNTYQPVLDAQNQVISQIPNVFNGPLTDDIGERFDGLHFSAEGTRKVADRWNTQLDANFFSTSTPQLATDLLLPESFCFNPNVMAPVVLNLPAGLNNPRWSNGVIGSRVSVGQGTFQGRATDAVGNTFFTPQIKYTSSPIPEKPLIAVDGPQAFCPGTAITRLNSTYGFNNIWNTNATTNGINVSTGGSYTVTHTNVYGCQSTSSPAAIGVYPEPDARITASGPTDICSDEELFLVSNTQNGNQWSTNQTEKQIRVQDTGTVTLTVTNSFGCKAVSAPLKVNVRLQASKPSINIDGLREFCADKSTNLIANSPDDSTRFVWNNSEATKTLNVNTEGVYSVLATNKFNCSKRSDEISIAVNALPNKPTIVADGPTSLCDNRSLRLSSNNQTDSYVWSNGDVTKNTTAFETGNYSLRTVNNKGCVSPVSDPLRVQFYETPLRPEIEKVGVFTLAARLPVEISEVNYNWTNGATILNKDIAEIKANKPGNYQAQAFKLYQLEGESSLKCVSEISNLIFVDFDVSVTYQVYPNPTINKTLSIETFEDYKNTYVTIYDYYGRLVKRFFVSDFNVRQTFDLSSISEGSYILKLDNPNLTITRRIIVQ
jgi:hypothetical protein